ncbi:S41 family peptidase [Achromobacter aloeverae]
MALATTMRIRKLLLPVACAIFMAATAPAAAAAPSTQAEIGTALAAVVNRITEQYVDPVDARTLSVQGLRGLDALAANAPPEQGQARRQAIDRAIQAEETAAGVAAQTGIVADEIMRFSAGAERDAALEAALRAMMTSLGPYNRLASPAEMAPPPASVGLELSRRDDALTVVRPLPGSPGERAGIQPGDVILSIDGRPAKDLPLPEAVALLRGAPGSSPALEIRRAGAAQALVVHPVRGPVQPPPSLRWTLHGDVAVIGIRAFDNTTQENFRVAIRAAALRADTSLGGLVLDLRGNAGGLLDVAQALGGMLLPPGLRIATLRGRTEANARRLVARQQDVVEGLPMVVLVDSRTGAGAEIVAAALQDHGRALLIGQKTAGAGTIQTVLPLPDGLGAMVLTTARVYRPNGARIETAGVTPDLLLDPATGQLTVRPDLAPDFNEALAKHVAEALASAPPGSDLAQAAALAAIPDTRAGGGTPR